MGIKGEGVRLIITKRERERDHCKRKRKSARIWCYGRKRNVVGSRESASAFHLFQQVSPKWNVAL